MNSNAAKRSKLSQCAAELTAEAAARVLEQLHHMDLVDRTLLHERATQKLIEQQEGFKTCRDMIRQSLAMTRAGITYQREIIHNQAKTIAELEMKVQALELSQLRIKDECLSGRMELCAMCGRLMCARPGKAPEDKRQSGTAAIVML